MKKIISALFVIISINVFGQDVFLGAKLGWSVAGISRENFPYDFQHRQHFNNQVMLTLILDSRLAFEAGIALTHNGFSIETPATDEQGNPTGQQIKTGFTYDYLTATLKGGYMGQGDFFGFAFAGIAPSFLSDAKHLNSLYDGNTLKDRESIDVTGRVNRFDINGLIELGAGYRVSSQLQFFVSGEFRHSFTRFTNNNYFQGSNMWHYTVFTSIGLRYMLT